MAQKFNFLILLKEDKIRSIHKTDGRAIENITIEKSNELHILLQEIKIFPDGSIFKNRAKFTALLMKFADGLSSDDVSIMMHKSAFLTADKTIASRTLESALVKTNAVAAYAFSRRIQKQLPLTLKVLEKDFDLIMSIPTSQLSDPKFADEIANRHPYRMGWVMEFSR